MEYVADGTGLGLLMDWKLGKEEQCEAHGGWAWHGKAWLTGIGKRYV